MKLLAYTLLVALFAASSEQAQRPRPPGLQQADQARQQAQNNIPPPTSQQARVDPADFRQEADELARLAQTHTC